MRKNGRAAQYLSGMRAGIPVLLGFIPVGIAYAVMARQAGFTAAQTVGMSLAVFAGASQMMAVEMYAQGAGLAAMIIAVFILNLRHIIMSMCVMNRIRSAPTGLKLLAAFGVTDESFAIFTSEREENCTISFFLGIITVTYSAWVGGSLIGAAVSDILPEILSASLAIALYALFIGLLIPGLTKNLRLGLLAVLTAVCNTLLSQVIASSWALIASTLLCAFAGVFFVDTDEENKEGRKSENERS